MGGKKKERRGREKREEGRGKGREKKKKIRGKRNEREKRKNLNAEHANTETRLYRKKEGKTLLFCYCLFLLFIDIHSLL